MYESHWDKEKKQPRSKSVMAFGYVHDLIANGIPDPVAYYTDFVARKNEERAADFAEKTRPRAFAAPVEYNLGYFLLHTLLGAVSETQYSPYFRSFFLFFFLVSLHISENNFKKFSNNY